jgi:hypothetical protein
MKNYILSQVRELLERGYNLLEIAHKLNLDPKDVQLAIEVIRNILT